MKIVLIVTNLNEFLGYYRMFIMHMKSMKKAKKKIILFSNKTYEQYYK